MINEAGKKKVLRLLLIVVTIMFSLGGFLMLLFSEGLHYYNKPSPSAVTKGNIYVTRPAARRQHAQCAIIYEVNGKKYENYGTGCSWFKSGDEVTVYYQPDDPSKSSIDARAVGYLFGFIGLVLGVAAFFLIKNFLAKLKE